MQEHLGLGQLGEMPIIFITGYGNVPMTVKAMKAGAIEVLTKPFNDDELLTRGCGTRSIAVGDALDREAALKHLRECYKSLSARGNAR